MSVQENSLQEAMTRYSDGVTQLDKVLEGLSDSDLDLLRGEGKWTIRQIVHHLVDVEEVWKTCIKAALGNPGCTVDLKCYILNNTCAGPLDYAHRPIIDGVNLFRAARRHIMELLNHLPNAWSQSFTLAWFGEIDGKTFTVGDAIGFQNIHMEHHLKQIQNTRLKHGI